jgi:hypothetical protein
MQCKHESATQQADHDNVTLAECDGCGAVLIGINDALGIGQWLTVADLEAVRAENARLREQVAALQMRMRRYE